MALSNAQQHRKKAEYYANEVATKRKLLADRGDELVLQVQLNALIDGMKIDLMQAQVHATLAGLPEEVLHDPPEKGH